MLNILKLLNLEWRSLKPLRMFFIFFIIIFLFLSQIQYSVILQVCVIWKIPRNFKVKQNSNRTTSMAKREEKVVVHEIYRAIVIGQIILETL